MIMMMMMIVMSMMVMMRMMRSMSMMMMAVMIMIMMITMMMMELELTPRRDAVLLLLLGVVTPALDQFSDLAFALRLMAGPDPNTHLLSGRVST